ncbi:uncharacterized protein LOC135464121 [Liolophura sinensis]|uniref:uncharacterized protein LOC135464121 n=1 Tax=Liolophura sinensis TaxID=3198878 RepID=UPI0031591A64
MYIVPCTMGTSLEAVQVKFASIIEDLSGCPHTLSQFVVWVDLCVAEYKSNGFIYLNCSGKKPEPSWLDGLKEEVVDTDEDTSINKHHFTDTSINKHHFTDTKGSHNTNTNRKHRHHHSILTDSVTSLCNSIVKIKTRKQVVNADTNNDTICCDHTKSHNETNSITETRLSETITSNRNRAEAQKRAMTAVTCRNAGQKVAGASTSISDHIYAMGVDLQRKQKSTLDRNSRIIPTSAKAVGGKSHTETISVSENRSQGVYPVGLIQVSTLGGRDANLGRQNSENIQDEEEEFLETVPNPLSGVSKDKDYGAENLIMGESSMDVSPPVMGQEGGRNSPLCGPHLHSHLVPTQVSSANRTPIIKTESESSLLESDYCNNNTGDDAYPGCVVLEISDAGELSTPVKTQPADDYWSSYGTCIPGPVKKARTNVGNMHRWLQQDQNELRQIEEIPPEELDPYLTAFLRLVRRKDGRDYDPNSFKDVRGSIQRYLQDHGYPYSIVRSPLFYNSQRAYYRKKEQLRHSLFLKNRKADTDLNYISFQ